MGAEYKVDYLKDLLWIRAKPAMPNCITEQDLIKCYLGDTIVSMLTDAEAFYDLEIERNRIKDPLEMIV